MLILIGSIFAMLPVQRSDGQSIAHISSSASRTTTYRMYDFFEEPFADFWEYRITAYDNEQILHSDYPRVYALMLGNDMDVFNYPPNADYKDWYQLCAPYRLNITAKNVKEWNTSGVTGGAWQDSALIVPIINSKAGLKPGNISFDWYWQYMNFTDNQDLYKGTSHYNAEYGIPAHVISNPISPGNPSACDGWYGYVKSQMTFDRDAAVKYLDGPKTTDLIAWYNQGANAKQIMNAWAAYWNQKGNFDWDIWTAYEYQLWNEGPFNVLNTTYSTSDKLVIDTFMGSWGWEEFMMRLLDIGNVTPNFQVESIEDTHFNGKINATSADINFDGVAQYSLTGWGFKEPGLNYTSFSWMIESSAPDYVSNAGYGMYPPTDTGWSSPFEFYSNTVNPTLTRKCELPGTPMYGKNCSYWVAPEKWSLSGGEQIVIQLPDSSTEVLGYKPKEVINFDDIGEMNLYAYWGNMTYQGGDLDANTVYDKTTNTVTVTGPAVPAATYNTSIAGQSLLTRGFPAWYFGVYSPPDFLPPVSSIMVYAYNGEGIWYVSNATVKISAEEPDGVNGSGIDYTECRLNGGPWQKYSDQFVLIDEGLYTIDYYSVDNVGNIESEKTRTIGIDKLPPELSFVLSDDVVFNSSSVTIYWLASDSASGIAGFEISLDGKAFVSLGNTTLMTNFTGLSDGNHIVILRAFDNAGKVTEETLTFQVSTGRGSISDPWTWVPILLTIAIAEAWMIAFLIYKRNKPEDKGEQKKEDDKVAKKD